jgi:hypothetical protein
MEIPTLNCYCCEKQVKPKVYIQIFLNDTKHVRADCPVCSRFLRYLPQEYLPLAENSGVNLYDLFGGWTTIPPKENAPSPVTYRSPKVETFWDDCLPENPLAKALVKEHGLFIRKDDEKQRYLIEFKTEKLMQIALRHISDIENALNRKYQAYYRAVFFSLEPLSALVELGVNDD